MNLPRRRKVVKSGILRGPQRFWPRHRRFVKSHCCVVPGCEATDIDFAHIKTVGSGGDDTGGISMCRRHHAEQHTIGIETFQAKYGIDLWALADAFVRASPDTAMKDAMREQAIRLHQVERI